MGGGILQLVARSIEDLYILGDPQITFFKIVYRRHVSFSMEPHIVNFKGKSNFGKKVSCVMPRLGDLIHTLTLMIDIPDVEMIFEKISNLMVYNELKKEYMNWNYGKENPDEIFNETLYDDVIDIIDNKINDFQNIIQNINNILQIIEGEETNGLTLDEYYNNLVESIIEIDNNMFNIYDEIKHYFNNILGTTELKNLDDVFNFYIKEFKLFLFNLPSNQSLSFDNQISIMNDNINVLNKIENMFFNSQSISTLKDYIIDNLNINFNKENNTTYEDSDSYKILLKYFEDNNYETLQGIDFFNIRNDIINIIRFNLIKNIKMLRKTISVSNRNFNFAIVRRFINSTNRFLTNEDFRNASIIPGSTYDDDFSKHIIEINKEENEPENLKHYFKENIEEKLNIFHNLNIELFNKQEEFKKYFDELNLWVELFINNLIKFKNKDNEELLTNVIVLNYIPIKMIKDIMMSIKNSVLIDVSYADFVDKKIVTTNEETGDSVVLIDQWLLDTEEDAKNKIIILEDVEKIKDTVQFKANGNDILITTLLRHFINIEYNGEEYTTIDYIIKLWKDKLDELIIEYNNENPNTQLTQNKIDFLKENIIDTYTTDIDDIPSFDDYSKLYSIALVKERPDLLETPLNIGNVDIISDFGSSFFRYIQIKFKENFNDFYNNLLYGENNLISNGKELYNYYEKIIKTELNGIEIEPNYYDYYSITNNIINNIIGEKNQSTESLTKRLENYNNLFEHYDNNKELLLIKNLNISKNEFYFGEINNITNEIETNLNNKIQNVNIDNNIITNTTNIILNGGTDYEGNNINKFTGVGDVIDNGNDSLLSYLENNLSSSQFDEFKKISNWDSYYFYNNINGIIIYFNNLNDSNDLMNFILNELQKKSDINNGIKLLKKDNITETKNAFVKYFNERKIFSENKINHLDNKFKKRIENYSKGGKSAKFAWINRLGHFIIDKIQVAIGGYIIDTHTGTYFETIRSLTEKSGKKRGYDHMIGDIPELVEFNDKKKNKYTLHIPLKFWFCNDIAGSIPLVNMIHSELEILLNISKLSEVAYWEDNAIFKRKPRLKTRLIADYIYLESEERKKMAKSKLEFLMENVHINDHITFNKNILDYEEFDDDNKLEITKKFNFTNPTKEMIWVFRKRSNIDGSLDNNMKVWNDFTDNSKDIMDGFSFYFNGTYRERMKSAKYYNIIQTLKHTKTPEKGIYNYNFALHPERLQPTGSANLSMLETFEGNFRFDKEIIDNIKNGESYDLIFMTRYYNILRVLSGMAGVAFVEC